MKQVAEGSSERGFSILEVIMVVAIILIVTALALPGLRDARDEYRLTAAASEVIGYLNNARVLPVTRNTDERLMVSNSSTYLVQEEINNVWTTQGTITMPTGFTIGTNGAIAEFHPRGNATAVATFTITNPDGNTQQVVVEVSGRSYFQ